MAMPDREERSLEYDRPIGPASVVRVRLEIERGDVIAFTEQLECYIEGRWRPVVRYDSAHGYAHRDTLDWDGHVVNKFWLDPTKTIKEIIRWVEADLTVNVDAYRAAFLERRS
jgi:hypothetical protein